MNAYRMIGVVMGVWMMGAWGAGAAEKELPLADVFECHARGGVGNLFISLGQNRLLIQLC
ncbi:MAG TPA: hypothetical protein VHP11_14155 [Tepidisphaeraceae bacterium]|nr:hypothetical protein [Tepidisphaeraceae bacterium]